MVSECEGPRPRLHLSCSHDSVRLGRSPESIGCPGRGPRRTSPSNLPRLAHIALADGRRLLSSSSRYPIHRDCRVSRHRLAGRSHSEGVFLGARRRDCAFPEI